GVYDALTVNVRERLAARFPNTGVRVSCPTVLVPFGTSKSEWTEVAPCDHVSTNDNGFKVYEIANGSGGWLKSSPASHNSYVKRIDDKHNGKVKELIRFIKAWKYYNDVPISSFYLELQTARYCDSESTIVHRFDIKGVFNVLLSNELASMQDP
ncbi:nucleotidyltransferase, partial [Vibrio anguillarum]|nr:nucleotidyltransferase [Vibrio anguillarum]